MNMFESGFAARSRARPKAVAHVVVTTGGEPQLYCSGGPAVTGVPSAGINRLCPQCLAAVREHDDAEEVFAELGHPWPER